jgi:putative endonuclease
MLGALRRALGRMRAPRTDKELGAAGERRAARLLRRGGYGILGRNVRLAIGEADIVCLAPDRSTIVVVEVKTRRRGTGLSVLGETVPPEASVHSEKRRKLRSIAAALARANKWEGRAIRIDVVAIEWHSDGSEPTMRHHQGAGGES